MGLGLGAAFEQVEEVQTVDFLAIEDAEERGELAVEQSQVVPDGGFGVKVGETCRGSRDSE